MYDPPDGEVDLAREGGTHYLTGEQTHRENWDRAEVIEEDRISRLRMRQPAFQPVEKRLRQLARRRHGDKLHAGFAVNTEP